MKSIIALLIVLVIGYLIGSFSKNGNGLFSFLNKDNGNNIQTGLMENAKKSIAEITSAAQKETGAVFDKQYLDAMITMYEGSVALSKIGTVAGGHAELRTTAKAVSKDDAATLAQLKKWRAEWFPKEVESVTKPTFVK